MAKYCTSCGTPLGGGSRFCPSCGTQVLWPQEQGGAPPAASVGDRISAASGGQSSSRQIQGGFAMTQKQQTLHDATNALNSSSQSWVVTTEGDSIIAKWKWMDANFFSPSEVTNEIRDYTFRVILSDKGTYRELDKTEEKKSGVNVSGSKIGFGSSTSSFSGKTNQKSFSFGTGKNSQTGEVGFISFKFSTSLVKQPIREYLAERGWKKAGLFG